MKNTNKEIAITGLICVFAIVISTIVIYTNNLSDTKTSSVLNKSSSNLIESCTVIGKENGKLQVLVTESNKAVTLSEHNVIYITYETGAYALVAFKSIFNTVEVGDVISLKQNSLTGEYEFDKATYDFVRTKDAETAERLKEQYLKNNGGN